MPKVNLTINDRRNALFKRQHRLDKAVLNKTDKEFASEMQIDSGTFCRKLKDPTERLYLREWLHLVSAWPEDVILQFVKGK